MVTSNRNPVPSFATLAIISCAMHVSLVLFVFVLGFISQQQPDEWVLEWRILPQNQLLLTVLTAIAMSNAMLSLLWPKIIKRKSAATDQSTQELIDSAAGAQQASIFLNFNQVDGYVQTTTITRFALAESVALFGFVQALLNHSFLVIVPYAVAGLIIQIMVGPFVGRALGPR